MHQILYLYHINCIMKFIPLLYICAFATSLFGQTKTLETVFAKSDSLYREDQFYFGITYNRLLNMPVDMAQNGLSIGVNAGFLRDFPINKSRTVALAAGFGISYNKYHQNLLVSAGQGTFNYEIMDDKEYNRNKFEQVTIDVPVEIRWRNSTPESHQFFRVYGGFKFSYLVFDKTKYVGFDFSEKTQFNSDFNKFQYGPYLSMGYNTWNLYMYYGLNPIFGSGTVENQKIGMNNLNFGLMFYIL